MSDSHSGALQAEPVTPTDAEATDQRDLVAPTADFDRRPAEQNGGYTRVSQEQG